MGSLLLAEQALRQLHFLLVHCLLAALGAFPGSPQRELLLPAVEVFLDQSYFCPFGQVFFGGIGGLSGLAPPGSGFELEEVAGCGRVYGVRCEESSYLSTS